MVKKIKINYYALLREQRGKTSEELTTEAGTAEALYNDLKLKYKFSLSPGVLKVAVNDAFADWRTELNDGDSVTFIPPVAGG